jgi:hypothetical protein
MSIDPYTFKPTLQASPRKGKRFRLVLPNKVIDFGQKGGKTYIDHGDKRKRLNYLRRHYANEDWTVPNAGSAAAWILWGFETNIEDNLNRYLKEMNISK